MDLAKKKYLSEIGIKNVKKIFYNLSYDELFKHETSPDNKGLEKGHITSLGTIAVDTGIFTGRSPKDKYIVREDTSKNYIWWASPTAKSSDNKPITQETWNDLYATSVKQLSEKKLYVQDGFAGANQNTRLPIRVVSEVAWMAHFVKNMFIRPTKEELISFEPEFLLINACKAVNKNWEKHNLYSDVYVAFNLKEKMALIGGTWYGGEIKKGIFSIMNYYLPRKNIASMHCSANMDRNGDTALFFGLSGTGKTTLSADPNRYLIGDDEHGWDEDGIFNLEGGCYAKCINLTEEREPYIYRAIRRNALLENAVFDKDGNVNFFDSTKTENIRVSYPINHIDNIVTPISKGKHPNKIIFLTADAFGVFPPVSRLTLDQAKYFFLSGYTSKLAGTERGVREPIPTFSPGFGAAFLLLHPTVYANILAKKMKEHGTTAYLVNTGWVGGDYMRGRRIDLQSTRNIITAILDGSLDNCEYYELPTFGLHIPRIVPGVDSKLLNPRFAWKYESRYVKQASMLAEKFIQNFQSFTDTEEGKRLVAAGPKSIYMKQFYDYYTNRLHVQEQKYREELQRLKDHIYILQESYKDYISFNSINTDFKRAKVNRYIPVVSFFNTNRKEKVEQLNKAVNNILNAIQYKYYTEEDHDAKYNKFIAISKVPLSRKEEVDVLKRLYRNANYINRKPNDIKKALIQFYKMADDIDEAILKIGSYLIIKRIDEEGVTQWISKELSISSQIYIDKNPEILKNSRRLFNELTAFIT